MEIPHQYQPRLITPELREGYLDWSLDFFTDASLLQIPYIDLTLPLNVTRPYQQYRSQKQAESSFFSFLLWHLVQSLKTLWEFQLRYLDQQWYVLDNPPIMITVAVGGKDRFWEMLLENVYQLNYPDFREYYYQQLNEIRAGKGQRADYNTFCLSSIFGNLPNLQFSGLTIQYRLEKIQGQPWFYFGKRYWLNEQLLIPLCARFHHANTDPLLFDQLITHFDSQFS